jgi:Flp pilus assembly protein TadD
VEGWKLANRAYRLQPENPEDIAALARTWVLLGEVDEAERLILEGLDLAGENANLLGTYWMILLVNRRFEEAESLVRELMDEYGENIPENLQRNFNFQLGFIAMIRGDFRTANTLLTSAVGDEDDPAWSGDEIMRVTMASLAAQYVGETNTAIDMLGQAERKIQRARLNGVDDPNIYYSEAVVLTMREDIDAALSKLNEAYERGWRELWVLEVDGRLDPLRDRSEFLSFKQQISDDLDRALAEIKSLPLAAL